MHKSVLLEEVIQGLNINESGIYVDCTLGYGGHASSILQRIRRGYLFAFDQDKEAIDYSKAKLSQVANNFTIIHSNFVNILEKLHEENIYEVDGILYDLGVSSPQLDEDERGFSYHKDHRLDMRMNQDDKLSAYEVVNDYDEEELIRIFFQYGEEKYARSIAREILKSREEKKIETTLELVEIIKRAVPLKSRLEKHPARKVFQAIRIEVNQELAVLSKSLEDALKLLKPKGRLAVISFHSLEDRIVKDLFYKYSQDDPIAKGIPNVDSKYLAKYKLINKKVITASKKELEDNPRARSAKLRIIERL